MAKHFQFIRAGILIGLCAFSVCEAQEMGQRQKGSRPQNEWTLATPYPYLSHPVFEFLERAETSQSIPLFSNSKPYLGLRESSRQPRDTTDRIVSLFQKEQRRYAQETLARHAVGRGISGRYDGEWLSMRRRIADDKPIARWLYDDGVHFVRWSLASGKDRNFAATFQPVYGFEYIDTDDARGTISRFTAGARIEGGYTEKLRFMVDFRDNTES